MEKQVKKVTIEHEGERLDAVVSSVFEDISRTVAQDLIKKCEILLDGKNAKVSSKVHEGMEVEVPLKIKEEVNESLVAEDIPIDILYEDDDILVVNKPKDMVVHPAVGNRTGTLVNAVLRKNKTF